MAQACDRPGDLALSSTVWRFVMLIAFGNPCNPLPFSTSMRMADFADEFVRRD